MRTSKSGSSGLSGLATGITLSPSTQLGNVQLQSDRETAWIVQVVGFGDQPPHMRVTIDFGGNAAQRIAAFDQTRRELRIGLAQVGVRIEKFRKDHRQSGPYRLTIA